MVAAVRRRPIFPLQTLKRRRRGQSRMRATGGGCWVSGCSVDARYPCQAVGPTDGDTSVSPSQVIEDLPVVGCHRTYLCLPEIVGHRVAFDGVVSFDENSTVAISVKRPLIPPLYGT